MPVQVSDQGIECHQQPSRHIPFPALERVILGGIAGVGCALAAISATSVVESAGSEAAAELFFVLAPLFAVLGAICGKISKDHGWAKVKPFVWAVLGGITLNFFSPYGWLLGGMLGGFESGIMRRSIRRVVIGAVAGAFLGTVAWLIVTGYSLCVIWLLERDP
jgi:hypothetical protein